MSKIRVHRGIAPAHDQLGCHPHTPKSHIPRTIGIGGRQTKPADLGLKIDGTAHQATVVPRLSRFSALARMGKGEETARVPTSGRMRELLVAGSRVS